MPSTRLDASRTTANASAERDFKSFKNMQKNTFQIKTDNISFYILPDTRYRLTVDKSPSDLLCGLIPKENDTQFSTYQLGFLPKIPPVS